MKNTFQNTVLPGTFWIRHNAYNIILDHNYVKIQKDDVVFVLGFVEPGINLIKDVKIVQCYSQKMNRTYTTTLENFYFNYHKL